MTIYFLCWRELVCWRVHWTSWTLNWSELLFFLPVSKSDSNLLQSNSSFVKGQRVVPVMIFRRPSFLSPLSPELIVVTWMKDGRARWRLVMQESMQVCSWLRRCFMRWDCSLLLLLLRKIVSYFDSAVIISLLFLLNQVYFWTRPFVRWHVFRNIELSNLLYWCLKLLTKLLHSWIWISMSS